MLAAEAGLFVSRSQEKPNGPESPRAVWVIAFKMKVLRQPVGSTVLPPPANRGHAHEHHQKLPQKQHGSGLGHDDEEQVGRV